MYLGLGSALKNAQYIIMRSQINPNRYQFNQLDSIDNISIASLQTDDTMHNPNQPTAVNTGANIQNRSFRQRLASQEISELHQDSHHRQCIKKIQTLTQKCQQLQLFARNMKNYSEAAFQQNKRQIQQYKRRIQFLEKQLELSLSINQNTNNQMGRIIKDHHNYQELKIQHKNLKDRYSLMQEQLKILKKQKASQKKQQSNLYTKILDQHHNRRKNQYKPNQRGNKSAKNITKSNYGSYSVDNCRRMVQQVDEYRMRGFKSIQLADKKQEKAKEKIQSISKQMSEGMTVLMEGMKERDKLKDNNAYKMHTLGSLMVQNGQPWKR